MLVYEDCSHEESTPQVCAMERAFKKSSEGQRLNKLIRERKSMASYREVSALT
jgi:hypothetical protein